MVPVKVMLGAAVAAVVVLVSLPTAGRAGVLAALAAGAWCLRQFPRRRRLVRHLAECIDALSGAETADGRATKGITLGRLIDAVRGRLGRSVRVDRWHRAEPLGPVRIRYSPRFFDGEASRRERFERIVDAKLAGSWSADWQTRRDRVTFTRTAELPTRVEYGQVAEHGDARALPVGVGRGGHTVLWRPDDYPHLLVGGRTRKGKSAAMRVLLVTWLRRGGRVMPSTPNRLTSRGCTGAPGCLT